MRKNFILSILFLSFGVSSLFSQTKFEGYYRLKTEFRGEGECLEGNEAASKIHDGAAFMDKAQNVLGQIWKIELQPNGYYRLKNLFRGEGECLEGNEAGSKVKNGSAFMDKVKNVTGQFWKITPAAAAGYYYLQTQFRGEGECLEGNQAGSPVHGGNAFMDKKQEVSGQHWKFEPLVSAHKYEVISAVWAVGDKKADVKARVQELANCGLPTFEARNHILFADPAAGQQKTLTVVYKKDGQEITKTCVERKFFEW